MYEPDDVVTTVDEIRATLGETFETQANKAIDHIDDHCRVWIERSPFVVIASTDASGAMDVSPKGDPPGFVSVLDPHTLAIPDRLGNRRADTLTELGRILMGHVDLLRSAPPIPTCRARTTGGTSRVSHRYRTRLALRRTLERQWRSREASLSSGVPQTVAGVS